MDIYTKVLMRALGIPKQDSLKVEYDLKQGFYLVRIEKKDNDDNFCHLYRDGVKMSHEVFRKGGMSTGFKDGYCQLMKYTWDEKSKCDYGRHCIINLKGEIVLIADSMIGHPYHLKGNIAVMKEVYYDLTTGKPIVKGSESLRSNKFIFIHNKYNKEYPIGVYKINWYTCEIEIFE